MWKMTTFPHHRLSQNCLVSSSWRKENFSWYYLQNLYIYKPFPISFLFAIFIHQIVTNSSICFYFSTFLVSRVTGLELSIAKLQNSRINQSIYRASSFRSIVEESPYIDFSFSFELGPGRIENLTAEYSLVDSIDQRVSCCCGVFAIWAFSFLFRIRGRINHLE